MERFERWLSQTPTPVGVVIFACLAVVAASFAGVGAAHVMRLILDRMQP